MKRIVFAFALSIALSVTSLVFAQNKCTVSGEVVYSGNSNIYVCLHNSTSWTAVATRQKGLPTPEFVQIVKVNGSGKAPFAFNNIPVMAVVMGRPAHNASGPQKVLRRHPIQGFP
jgi:hypothetical protein